MRYNTSFFGRVGTMSLVGGLAVALPASAQSPTSPQYGTTRTPAQLGQETQPAPQGYSGGQEQPPYGYNQQPGVSSANAYGGVQNTSSAPGNGQLSYHQELQRYQDQQQLYMRQRAQYENDSARYRRDWRGLYTDYGYEAPHWGYFDARPYTLEYQSPQLMRLYLLAEPSQQLTGVPVQRPNGLWIGRVQSVQPDVDGRPLRVEVSLGQHISVWVDPTDLRFDPDERVVVTELTRGDLWAMPGSRVETRVENGQLSP